MRAPFIIDWNKKWISKQNETKKERLKEPLKMFYVTKVSFLND